MTPPASPIPILQTWGHTDPGLNYKHNEDTIYPNGGGDGVALPDGATLLLVADGVGGSQVGEVASQMVADETVRYIEAQTGFDTPTQTLADAVQSANVALYNYVSGSTTVQDAASTLVAALVVNGQLHIANVGDSRAYLIRNGSATQQTKDHTLTQQKVDRGLLRPEQAQYDSERNVITRSMGAALTVEIDTFGPTPLQPGDVLLLCSDGLTDVVEDTDLTRLISRRSPKRAAKKLVATANKNGGPDNISAVVGRVPGGKNSTIIAWPYLLVGFGLLMLLLAIVLLAGGFIYSTLFSNAETAMATETMPVQQVDILPTATTTIQQNISAEPAAMPGSGSVGDIVATSFNTSTPLPTYTAAPIPTLNINATPPVTAASTPLPKQATSPLPNKTTPAATPPLPVAGIAAPVLVSPEEKYTAAEGQSTTFKWTWPGKLAENQGFEILIWREGEHHNGAFDAKELKKYVTIENRTYVTSFPVEGAYSVQLNGSGEYQWTVVVVRLEQYDHIGPEAQPRKLIYALKGRSGEGKGKDKDEDKKDNEKDEKPKPDKP